jgi:hypothetical protein
LAKPSKGIAKPSKGIAPFKAQITLDSNLIREMFFSIHAVMQKPDDFYIVAFHAIKNQVALLVIASIT